MKFHLQLSNLFKSEAKLKLIKFLIDHEASMSEREIASILKISHMSVNRTLRELNELNLLSYITVGKAHLWKVNRQSYAYEMLKELAGHLVSIKDPIQVFKQMILKRLSLKLIEKVVLFGSILKEQSK